MSNKCPKCNVKLSPFYFKPNCPKCGVNIMQYGFEERLEESAQKAEYEWQKVETLVNGIKSSSVGFPVAVFRLISFVLPVIALLIPVYKIEDNNINLIMIIKSFINDSSLVFDNKGMLICFISFVSVILFSILCAVVSLFSFTKNGFKRNIIFSLIEIIVFILISIMAAVNGCAVSFGAVLVLIFQTLTLFLHTKQNEILLEKKTNEQ